MKQKLKKKSKGYVNLNLQVAKEISDNKKRTAWLNAFEKWRLNRDYIELFKNQNYDLFKHKETTGPISNLNFQDRVLVEVFIYVPEKTGDSAIDKVFDFETGLSEYQLNGVKAFPFVKVIFANDKNMIGKTYLIDDDICSIAINPEYKKFIEIDSTGTTNRYSAPPKWVSNFANWVRSNYRFRIDKFKTNYTVQDDHIFYIPKKFLLGEYK